MSKPARPSTTSCSTIGLFLLPLLGALAGCTNTIDTGHGHGHGHGAQGHGAHGHTRGAEPVALTLWSKTHELFVEFDALTAGKRSRYHAHVSRLADNRAATSGRFLVRFEQQGRAVVELKVEKVARQGIFTPAGRCPTRAGSYGLVFIYEQGQQRSSWDAGPVKLSAKPARMARQAEGGVAFLKEQQWRIDFATRLPRLGRLARELVLPATVAADPGLTRTVTAPSAGAVFWAGEHGPSVIGMTVKRGQVLGRLLPAAAREHVSSLRLQIQRSQITRDHARQTLERLASLARDGLVPARQVTDARVALDRAGAALTAARLKVGQLRGRGPAPLPLVSAAAGTLVELHVTDGHQASAGQVLAHVAAEGRVLVRAAVFSLDLPRMSQIHRARLVLPGRPRGMVLASSNSRLLTRRVVVDPDTLTAPVTYSVDNSAGALRIGELAELRLAVGRPQQHLTVPGAAVVEINTRPCLFVMRTGESFDRLLVRLGPTDGQRVAVLSGLEAMDRVVTAGAFDVYAASLSGSVESHRH